MQSEYERELEAEIDEELKGLPELSAPHTLVARVRLAIEPAEVAWHRQPWQMWPGTLRIASLVLLLTLFGGLWLAGERVAHGEAFISAAHRLGHWLSDVSALGKAVSVLLGAAGLAVKQLGMGITVAALLAVAVGYAMCLGLGTVCVRLAFARR